MAKTHTYMLLFLFCFGFFFKLYVCSVVEEYSNRNVKWNSSFWLKANHHVYKCNFGLNYKSEAHMSRRAKSLIVAAKHQHQISIYDFK